MKGIIGKMVRKKDQVLCSLSPPRYAKLDSENDDDECHEIRRGYVPVMVGREEGEEERFMVSMRCLKHPSIVALLQLSVDEFEYHYEGVLHIPCGPNDFREIVGKLSSKKKW